MTTAKQARKTLLQLGSKGGDDRVRVLEDAKANEVVVQYKDALRVPRRKVFPCSKQGRRDAIEWGKTYHAARHRTGGARRQITHAELWKAYAESPAYQRCRAKTHENYFYHWRKWMHFRGEKTHVDLTTLHHVDQFYAASKLAGTALNQIRQTINIARIVYTWGQSRKLVNTNELSLYRWSTPKGEEALEPEEYSEAEFFAILAELNPQSGKTWRAHVAWMLVGHQGLRANAVLHLSWQDCHEAEGLFTWPAKFQKNGLAFEQPMTWDAVAALETARYWRNRLGYTGTWVLFAGGGNKALGAVVSGSERSYRKDRTPEQDTAYTYQALHRALYGNKDHPGAEARAGVAHKPRRGFHGGRKMVAGNVADRTGDDRLAMNFIGDRDLKQAKKYIKRRRESMQRAADAVETKAPVKAEVPE